jgi:peptidoglycan/LPS O-acetylase OafA/YrhL
LLREFFLPVVSCHNPGDVAIAIINMKAPPSPAVQIRGQEASPERLVQLDGLRALAFLAVFLHHSLDVPMLWAGVDLFFVLSGFLITGILLRASKSSNYFTTFYYRRFLRIFPPYYLTLLLVFLFFDSHWTKHVFWYAFYLSNFHDAFTGESFHLLSPMWSLALEEQFYILWPLLVYYLGQKGLWRLAIVLVLATPALRAILTEYSHNYMLVYRLLITRVDLLAAGAILAILWQRSPTLFRRLSVAGPFLSLFALLIFGYFAWSFADFRTTANSVLFNSWGYSLVGVIMFGIVAYCIPHRDNPLGRFLSSRVMGYLGTISYTMYLSHQMILDLVKHLGLPALLSVGTALLGVVLWSALSWHTIEKPLQSLKNKRVYAGARG